MERVDAVGRSRRDRRGEGTRTKNDPTQEQIDDYIWYCILDTKFNVNYKTVIIYDYQNTLILIYYSLIYYYTILIKKGSIKYAQPLNLRILL
jgi:hypothetical protein